MQIDDLLKRNLATSLRKVGFRKKRRTFLREQPNGDAHTIRFSVRDLGSFESFDIYLNVIPRWHRDSRTDEEMFGVYLTRIDPAPPWVEPDGLPSQFKNVVGDPFPSWFVSSSSAGSVAEELVVRSQGIWQEWFGSFTDYGSWKASLSSPQVVEHMRLPSRLIPIIEVEAEFGQGTDPDEIEQILLADSRVEPADVEREVRFLRSLNQPA